MASKLTVSFVFLSLYIVCGVLCKHRNNSMSVAYNNNPCFIINSNTTYIEKVFQEFVALFNKSYLNDNLKYLYRHNVFKQSLKRQCSMLKQSIRNSVMNGGSADYGINQFSDITPKEFHINFLKMREENVSLHPIKKSSFKSNIHSKANKTLGGNIPAKWDWRKRNIVTAVRNQRSCGACWAFSSVEAIESQYALKTGNLTKFSVQQVIDCAEDGNYGCKGGDTCRALQWLKDSRLKLVPENVYPLTDEANSCLMKQSSKYVQLLNYNCLSYVGKEKYLVQKIYEEGPISVTVNAASWQDYLGGIIQFHCSDPDDHAVLIVGYDLTGPIPYYIVKNSWGRSFGHDGYLYVEIGDNVCGIVDEVAFVYIAT